MVLFFNPDTKVLHSSTADVAIHLNLHFKVSCDFELKATYESYFILMEPRCGCEDVEITFSKTSFMVPFVGSKHQVSQILGYQDHQALTHIPLFSLFS